ncbi:MAG: hypothetical protein ABI596_02405 [Pyrinomonadaceae bacterium]
MVSFNSAKILLVVILLPLTSVQVAAQKRRVPSGGRLAVVIDERLAALRSAPDLSGRLVSRLSRGRLVAIRNASRSRDGVIFFHVAVTRRTLGWVQAEALLAPWRAADDDRSLRLVRSSEDFDRIARGRLFLDAFPRSPLRPQALLLFGDAAEAAAEKLSREAARRLNENEMAAGGAPEFSYFLNYSGLDRYNRQAIRFTFDRSTKRFHYDGAAWRELLRRYPRSPEAAEAKVRLDAMAEITNR